MLVVIISRNLKAPGAMGSSIITQITKEELLASFAKWMGWNDNEIKTLKEMAAIKEFHNKYFL
jgi:hypothetical protein